MTQLDWIDSIIPALRVNLQPARIFDRVMACIERNQQRRALARLDSRLLSDIGIGQADAIQEYSKPCWKE